MSELLVLLLVLPLAGALLSALGRWLPRVPLGPLAALVSTAVSLALLARLAQLAPAGFAALPGQPGLAYQVGRWSEPVGIVLYLDDLAWLASVIGQLVALCALLFAVSEGGHPPGFYPLFLLLVFGMQGVILTGDLFNLFVFLEVLSIASYVLIASPGKPQALVAALRYLMISSLGIAFFLVGVFLFYRAAGNLSLGSLAGVFDSASPAARRSLELAVVCLVVGAGVKAAFLPFHTWLPEAHAAAPHAVSAVLSGVMIKVSFLVVWRLLRLFAVADLQAALLWVGAITAVFGVGAAIAQVDVKRLLAYHSVSQMGYIVAAFGAGVGAAGGGASPGPGAAQAGASIAGAGLALTACLYHLLSHALFKSLLFLAVGAVIHVSGERDLRRLGGGTALAGRLPLLFVLFLVGAFSIGGLPPFNGYVSKGLITAGLKGQPLAYGLILLAGAGTVASMLKLSGIFFRPATAARGAASEAAPAAADSRRRRLPLPMYLPLALLALLCLATGLLPSPLTAKLATIASGTGLAQPLELRSAAAAAYSLPHLVELAGTVVAGIGLFLLASRTQSGRRLLAWTRARALGLNAALALLVGGLLLFVLLAWLL